MAAKAGFTFGPRRGVYLEIPTSKAKVRKQSPLAKKDLECLKVLDSVYRSLCALMFNYVPMSGHPGGSISSGRIVQTLLFHTMNYDLSEPGRPDADIISYAAGHKALGLYAIWALRNEIARLRAPALLPARIEDQLRLEDLLGFRRNPTTNTPLFVQHDAKALDGHPTPATPFVRLSTGASGVGVASSLGLAFGAMDTYGIKAAPRVHIIEGEGGLTPGRVAEAMAAAGTASLKNAILHIDWNQASIDSNRVCREGKEPGEYVQWTPMELAWLHDWNVIFVKDGFDFSQIALAQNRALKIRNGQPTAIVYRTTKGWKYGIEGKASHGAGHKLCADAFFHAVSPIMEKGLPALPRCGLSEQLCQAGKNEIVIEGCFWQALEVIRAKLDKDRKTTKALARKLSRARDRLDKLDRKPRKNAADVSRVYELAKEAGNSTPEELQLEPGQSTTLRAELGRALGYYNRQSGGAILASAADLLGSTSVNLAAQDFPEGYFNSLKNPEARLLSVGGICEDAMAGLCSGLATYGNHIGLVSSYGAFVAPLGHIAARLHAIGNQAKQAIRPEPFTTFFLICAHAGLKTGEDGPTHADPQPLQLLQNNFPAGTLITLTPWDPQEVWPLVTRALALRPAIIAPFVTRPDETVIDRSAAGLAPASDSVNGMYCLLRANGQAEGTIVIQGSGVAYAFIEEALPLLREKGVNLDVFYVSSAELFDALPPDQRMAAFSEDQSRAAMGISGFTLPTLHRWIQSDRGREMSLYPFRKGHYLGSGQARRVMAEAGLDGQSQFEAIMRYVEKNGH